MLKKLLFTLTLLVTVLSVQAEIAVYKNAYRIAGTANDYGDFIQVDNNGNVYVAGRFGSGCDFDPSAGTSTLTPNGSLDIFLAKYTSAGALEWKFAISGTTEQIRGMQLDPSGNIYVFGDYTGTLTVGATGTGTSFVSAGQSDAYVVKYDPSGQILTSFSFGDLDIDYAYAMAFDSNGDFYLGGEFQSPTLDLDPGASTSTISNYNSAGTTYDNYLSKFSSNGTFIWGFGLPTNLSAYTRSLAVDNNGNVLIGGYYNDSLLVDSANGTMLYSVAGSIDCFVARYSANGAYDNAWTFGSTGTDNLLSLTTHNNEIFVTGTFTSPIDVAPGSDVLTLTSNGGGDVFVAKWDVNGGIVWGKNIGGDLSDLVSLISCNSTGDVYVVGSFTDSAYFDNGLTSSNIIAYGDRDGFIAKYSNTGSYIYAHKIGGTLIDYSRGVAFTSNGDFWTSGYYNNSSLYLDPSNPINNLPNAGVNDIFFARYGECSFPVMNSQPLPGGACPGGNTSFTINASGQNITYQWQEGLGITWTSLTDGGIYGGTTTTTLSLTGVGSNLNNRLYRCIITADCGLSTTSGVGILYVGVPDTSISSTTGSLTANQANGTYQWLDCNNGFAAIPGATSRSFFPTVNGTYSAAVTFNGCTDTSGCYTLTTAGLQLISGETVNLFPVPAKNQITIELSKSGEYAAGIYDINGRILSQTEVSFSKNLNLEVETLSAGIYLVGIRKGESAPEYFRFIKQ